MAVRGGIVLSNSSIIGSTALVAAEAWPGGRSQIVVCANQYGTGVTVQVKGPPPQANWIPICSSFVSDQIFNFDAPPGQYRVVSAGSSVSLSLVMTGVTYL